MKPWMKVVLWGLCACAALGILFWSAEGLFRLLVYCFGPEFFVGAANVRHLEDGSVIYTNPAAMLFWVNVLAIAEILLIAGIARGVRAWRARRG